MKYSITVIQQGDGISRHADTWQEAKEIFLAYTAFGQPSWGRTVTLRRKSRRDVHSGRLVCYVAVRPCGFYHNEKAELRSIVD